MSSDASRGEPFHATRPGPADLACTPEDYRRVLLADVNDLLDADGRPIGEIRASESVRIAARSQYQLCTYSGSRSRKPHLINSSALDQVTSNWPAVLDLLWYVRSGCIPERTSDPPLIELARAAAAVLMRFPRSSSSESHPIRRVSQSPALLQPRIK